MEIVLIASTVILAHGKSLKQKAVALKMILIYYVQTEIWIILKNLVHS